MFDILQEISVRLGLETMCDYGLFLDYYDMRRLLDSDENVEQMLRMIHCSDEEEQSNEEQGFWGRMGEKIAVFKKTLG